MKTYTQGELSALLVRHVLYLKNEGGARANLRGANLEGANLEGANLRDANLRGANLESANLEGVKLWGANLEGANLEGANLRYANLRDANLRDANLRDANLESANLGGANLRGANLEGANLEGVKLWAVRGNRAEVKSVHLETYDIAYTNTHLQIGCARAPIEDWWGFTDHMIGGMDVQALEFWSKWKDYIKMTIDLSPAEATNYKQKGE